MAVKGRGGEGLFIGLESSICPVLEDYVCILFTSNPNISSYVQ
jgi:hypothetical protein